jgi:hypothetical protein
MNQWFERKRNGEKKPSKIKVLEIDCEMFGDYQRLINRVFENPSNWDTLSEDEKGTFDEGRRVLSDLYWFGWGKTNS